jgi:CheY-like chemotaxis protein
MPEINGYELCKKIRKITNVPIIAVTGFFSSNNAFTSFDSVLFKPYSETELIELISKFI